MRSYYYVRGNAYKRLNELTMALDNYKLALVKNSRHTDHIMKCGIVYPKLNNIKKACEYFKKACELGENKACELNNKFCNYIINMKTSKTLRNYKYLIITIINFLALFIAKIYYEYIDNLEYNGVTNYDFYTDKNYKNFLDFNSNQQKILANVLLISVIISLFIVIKKIKNFKSGIEKLILGVWFIYTISIIVGLIDRQMYGDYAYKIYNTYFINYLLFIPHIMLIYKYCIIGKTVDLF